MAIEFVPPDIEVLIYADRDLIYSRKPDGTPVYQLTEFGKEYRVQ